MLEKVASIATTTSAVGCGLTAGVLLAFSVGVMPALRTRPAADAAATMQQINNVIVSPVFLTVFLGAAAAAAAVAAAVTSLASGGDSGTLVVAGAVVYVVGCVAVTVAINVPLNDSLASVDPSSSHGASVWADYLTRWTRWNHARTAAATLACAVLTAAARI
ncbi:anthrone oxygenase family protein [Rhodococcoides fascians]|uniref:anthrone oxygenase family protein n=1 Tax=Rhodococcoides fascians TaxID=1828 RepID=UPI0006923523|nr:anthrone oxygenase family protein [Rhodococcus fascians]